MLRGRLGARLPLLLLLLLVPRQLEEQAQDRLQLAVDDVIAVHVIDGHAERPQMGQAKVQVLYLRADRRGSDGDTESDLRPRFCNCGPTDGGQIGLDGDTESDLKKADTGPGSLPADRQTGVRQCLRGTLSERTSAACPWAQANSYLFIGPPTVSLCEGA